MKTINKNYIYIIIGLFLFTVTGKAQYNKIQERRFTDNSRYVNPLANEAIITEQYFNGVGDLLFSVDSESSPLKNSLVRYYEYDKNGRLTNSWLSLPDKPKSGYSYINVTHTKEFYQEEHPYSTIVYDNSPLNRVKKQIGEGDWWRTNQKSIRIEYGTNIKEIYPSSKSISDVDLENLTCTNYKVVNGQLAVNGNYPEGELYVTCTWNEDDNLTIEFVDMLERTILTRQINENQKHDTYFVYDDFNNLSYVLPPLAVDKLTVYDDDDDIMQQYAYVYKYNGRSLCIKKRLPGCDWMEYVYDEADNMIFCRDGEQKSKQEWLFMLYDTYSRNVLTGICNDTVPVYDKVVKASFTGGEYKGYNLNIQLPFGYTIYEANYYDNYDFLNLADFESKNLEFSYNSEFDDAWAKDTTSEAEKYKSNGMLTGRIRSIFGMETITCESFYYNNVLRLIQTGSTNHLGGIDKEFIKYDYFGQPVTVKRIHSTTNKSTQIELYTYIYDHQERLLRTIYKINDETEIVLVENSYDELGRLKTNKKGSNDELKSIYDYNIRSWLNKIESGTLFSQSLTYTPGGNISEMKWYTNMGEQQYYFSYDQLSRITRASHFKESQGIPKGRSYSSAYSSAYGNSIPTGESSERNYNTAYAYDKQGNILTLTRYGKLSTDPVLYGIVDHLFMSYQGNQLVKVRDAGSESQLSYSSDFKDLTNGSGEYLYNRNGALVKDSHKGVMDIQYNSLNLPQRMDIKSPVAEGRNEYLYSAGGTKLRVIQRWNPDFSTNPELGSSVNESLLTEAKVTDYVGNKIYENGELKRVLIDGGYYDPKEKKFYFYLTDHLGNNRIVADKDDKVIQENHYYPFGGSLAEGTGKEVQPYKYNGKELDTMHGLNLYDYSARYYEPAIGRFTTVDPLAEKYYSVSPYAYVGNNPMNAIDPDGKKIRVNNKNRITAESVAKIAATDLGEQRVRSLINDNKTYKLNARFMNPTYNPKTLTINYVSDPWYSEVPRDGGSYGADPAINMAHELQHAYDHSIGRFNEKTVDDEKFLLEPRAVSFTNNFRKVYSYLPYRKRYGSYKGDYNQFSSHDTISDFTSLGNTENETSFGFSFTKSRSKLTKGKGFFPELEIYETKKMFIIITIDTNRLLDFQIYDNEKEYNAAKNW